MSCGGKRSENKNAALISDLVAEYRGDVQVAEVRRLFHSLAADAHDDAWTEFVDAYDREPDSPEDRAELTQMAHAEARRRLLFEVVDLVATRRAARDTGYVGSPTEQRAARAAVGAANSHYPGMRHLTSDQVRDALARDYDEYAATVRAAADATGSTPGDPAATFPEHVRRGRAAALMTASNVAGARAQAAVQAAADTRDATTSSLWQPLSTRIAADAPRTRLSNVRPGDRVVPVTHRPGEPLHGDAYGPATDTYTVTGVDRLWDPVTGRYLTAYRMQSATGGGPRTQQVPHDETDQWEWLTASD